MMNNYPNVLSMVYNKPWAIWRSKWNEIDQVVRLRMQGAQPIGADDFRAEYKAAAARRETRVGPGGVAVIPIVGTIMHRAGMFEASGGVSTQTIQANITAALENSQVSALVFDIDTPGGPVDGVPELAEWIRANRNPSKPMIGVVNAFMASGGTWIGSQFDEVVITPSGEAGSIGVFAVHADWSVFNEAAGIEFTYVVNESSPDKVSMNPDEPLSEAGRDELQASVNYYADLFETAVGKGRGVSASKVRSSFGGGQMFTAKNAVAVGLVDRIATLDETIARMAKRQMGRNRSAARQRVLDIL